VPSYPLRVLVLKTTKLGETDIIVTLLAVDGRQVRAVAKGMRKPTSRFASRLQPFSVVDLLLHTGRNLEIVSEAECVSTHSRLREDFDRSAAASVVANVLDKISLEGQVEERLFALADATLDSMETAPIDALPLLVVAFLVKAMAMHGYRPRLDTCVSCTCVVTDARTFSLDAGGVLCPDCDRAQPGALRMGPGTRDLLATLMMSTMADAAALDVPPDARIAAFSLMQAFVTYHLPTKLKALDFYSREICR
jgi:DNA repair protein RecO (recombination protein O)